MNNNLNIINHMRTDPNAIKHSVIGCLSSGIGAFGACLAPYQLVPMFIVSIVVLPLLAGISIEIIQRLQGGKNTRIESIFDAETTWLWPLSFIIIYLKRRTEK